MELIKTAVRVGNSAGVLLPKKWLGSEVKIMLEPLNIHKDVLEILMRENVLPDVLGAYIVGSYAREEESIKSDIDILIVTYNTNKQIKKERYEIICMSKKELERQLTENCLPLLPMLKEAKIIINPLLIKSYTDTILNEKNLKWHIETTKSAMKFVEKDIEIAKEINGKVGDSSAYSLVLRLRTLYIINCIRKKEMWKKKEFLRLIKKVSGSVNAYERYLLVKDKDSLDYKLPAGEAEKLMDYINKELEKIEKWLKEKRD